MSQAPRQERALRTRALLIDSAITCLVEHGHAGTTMQRVQDMANVSRGTLTHHFSSIHALLAAAIQHIATGQLAEITHLVEAGEQPSSAHEVVDLVRPFMSGTLFIAGLELWSAARTNPELKAAVLPAEQRLGAQLRRLLSPAIDRGDLEMLLSLFRGLAMTSILREDLATDSAILERWAELVDEQNPRRTKRY